MFGYSGGYTPLHQIAEVYQDHAAAATTSSPSIEYTYANADPDATDGGNYSRIAGVDYPTDVENSTTTMAYGYGAAGSIDDRISRVAGIDVTGWDGSDPSLVDYTYLGVSTPVKVHYPLPTAGLGLDYTKEQDGTDGATAGAYPGFDQYGRVIWHAWISDGYTTGTNAGYADRTPVIARMYAYDDDSNRTRDWDARPGAVSNDRDWAYSYDPLDRLETAFRGRQTPGASGSGPVDFVIQAGSEKWDLDILGNWDESYKDLDGTWTVNWNASTEGRTRTHNMANEILTREGVIGSGPGGSTPIFSHQHDANGNLRANNGSAGGRSLRYVHDAWNRLVKVERWPSTGSPFAILENEFNGLNWRIRRKMDLSQGAYNGVDEERLYFFTPSWQMIEEWVDDDLDSAIEYRAQQFWGVRYIDDAVARRLDRDNDGAWTTDAEDNWYYLTDVMFSVRGITDNDGQIHTRVDYTPYGVAMHQYAADVDGNGLINNNDITVFSANASPSTPWQPGDSGYDPDADLNGDGFTDSGGSGGYSEELTVFFNQRWSPYATSSGTNPTVNAGWIDNPKDPNGPDNSIGYDGYWFDLAGAADATGTGLYMVRHRVYDAGLGRWSSCDLLVYIDSSNLYELVQSNPISNRDPTGLCSNPCECKSGTCRINFVTFPNVERIDRTIILVDGTAIKGPVWNPDPSIWDFIDGKTREEILNDLANRVMDEADDIIKSRIDGILVVFKMTMTKGDRPESTFLTATFGSFKYTIQYCNQRCDNPSRHRNARWGSVSAARTHPAGLTADVWSYTERDPFPVPVGGKDMNRRTRQEMQAFFSGQRDYSGKAKAALAKTLRCKLVD